LAFLARSLRYAEQRPHVVELEALLERSYLLDPAECADDDICHVLSTQT
jgi:hypothetical protein